MEMKRVVEQLEIRVKGECGHYWLIESPDGPISKGRCKLCGVEKEFSNSWTDSESPDSENSVFSLPELTDVDSVIIN
jgi:hypothetical protein